MDVACEANGDERGAYAAPLPRLASSLAQLGSVAGLTAPAHEQLYQVRPRCIAQSHLQCTLVHTPCPLGGS